MCANSFLWLNLAPPGRELCLCYQMHSYFFLFLVKGVTLALKVTPCTIRAVLTTIDWEIPALQLAVSSVWQVRNNQQQVEAIVAAQNVSPDPRGWRTVRVGTRVWGRKSGVWQLGEHTAISRNI